ncbi:thiamine phosphate synthase [Candidatus Methylospira mobilis]|uniref:thiamine phosphate synthase n=1 Tax=Candidatus Methylospira mobilis TaxID=1808979 RepID=UPI001D1767F1|nr:thiamine phosphate synthase [Candidatus Methylospira mobilis]WNV05222.1 thiamine phosphate synthase [Candidatus Methylospira mobilis]
MSTVLNAFPASGLYAVTPDIAVEAQLLIDSVRAVIAGGAGVVQYRAKSRQDEVVAAQLLAVCREAGIPLIINDNIVLAQKIGADGVHLGKDDMPVSQARKLLGASAIVGASCYDSLERAAEASAQGADYLAFGRFFPSQTKPLAPCANPATLSVARSLFNAPIVAIGGITAANGADLIAAGAGLLAVVDGVFGQKNPEQAARSILSLFR